MNAVDRMERSCFRPGSAAGKALARGILAFSALVVSVPPLPAQTSVGIRFPQNIKPILEYRLPDWGYRKMSARFSFDGRSNAVDNEGGGNPGHAGSESFTLRFSPDFQSYRESENKTQSLRLSASSDFYGMRSNDYQRRTTDNDFLVSASMNYKLSAYVGSRVYFTVEGLLNPRYEEDLRRMTTGQSANQTSREASTYKSVETSLKLGVGIGRVRDITPLVRALRLAERYHALGKADTIRRENIRHIANTIASRSGYYTVFDRPDQRFWRDLFEGILDVDAMSPFEFNYLKEALNEVSGSRFQGAMAEAGVLRELDEQWRKMEYSAAVHPPPLNPHQKANSLGFFMNARWYRNLSVNRQIGLRLQESSTRLFGELPVNGYTWNHHLLCSSEHLFVLSDRILWRNTLQLDYEILKRNQGSRLDNTIQTASFKSDFYFYLEDALSLSASLQAVWRDDHERILYTNRKNRDIWLSMGLNYHLLRGME